MTKQVPRSNFLLTPPNICAIIPSRSRGPSRGGAPNFDPWKGKTLAPRKPVDGAVFRLNTSAVSFYTWLLVHYLKEEFPLENGPWRLQRPVSTGVPGARRMDIFAVPLETPGENPRRPNTGPAGELAFRYDFVDVGTKRDARVEVVAVNVSPSLPLRVHFYGVLGAIAATWPEAAPSLNPLSRNFGQEVGVDVVRAYLPHPPPPAGTPLWEQIPDEGWDRPALELFHQGLSHRKIAHCLGLDLTEKTVCNRMSVLRKTYGDTIVPRRRTPRRRPSR